ncbi:MAG: hypothetical protein ACLUTA_15435 [Blautia wexlerae]
MRDFLHDEQMIVIVNNHGSTQRSGSTVWNRPASAGWKMRSWKRVVMTSASGIYGGT